MIHELKVRGWFKGPSGYDRHTRAFVRELARAGVAVQLVDLEEPGATRLPAELRDRWFESLTAPAGGRVLLQFTLPDRVVVEPGRVNVNFTMYEASRIPPAWVAAHHLSDLIVLPAEASRRAWIESGVPAEKLRLCPLGVGEEFFGDDVPPLDLRDAAGRRLDDYRVRFLNVSEIGARKNLAGLLRAWLRATTPGDDAVLIIKLGAYRTGSLAEWDSELEYVQRSEGKMLAEAAPLQIILDILADAEMPRLFAAATHYLSMSLGEGWDLPMIEAAAAGLKLIAPDHGAYRAYLDGSVASLIPVRRQAAGPGGERWSLPDEDAAVALIRRAIEGRDGGTATAREQVRNRFSWQSATRRLIEVLDEAEGMTPR